MKAALGVPPENFPPAFELGQVLTTCGIAAKMQDDVLFQIGVQVSLRRHSRGDWGCLCDDDKTMNDEAIAAERRGEPTDQLFSAYMIGDEKIYIITEYDRKTTTILLPSEY